MIPLGLLNFLACVGGITLWGLIGIICFLYVEWILDQDDFVIAQYAFAVVGAPLMLLAAIVMSIIQPFRFLISLKEDHEQIKKKLKIT